MTLKASTILLLAASAFATPALGATIFDFWKGRGNDSAVSAPETVTVAPGEFQHRPPGEYLKAGKPTGAPMERFALQRPIHMMKYQVSLADYGLCVADGACMAPENRPGRSQNVPVTGVNFLDAQAYAKWLSEKTGKSWRLPTDEEWAFAAASKFGDDLVEVAEDPGNPAVRWIAQYRKEAERIAARDPEPKEIGHYGPNENGIFDLSGNVWEWTQSCYQRVTLSESGEVIESVDNCGVRIVEGRHRSYMSTFVREGKSGGCAFGTPPDNLGFRLVWEEPALISRVMGL